MKKAIILGSTGFVGSFLLDQLLADQEYEQVITVVRKDQGIKHPKLKTLAGDYSTITRLKDQLVADEIYLALGTTKKNTPDKKEYYQVDHDYPVLAAKLAKENGANSVFIVSAVGADKNSGVNYIKMKGETESDLIALDFKHTHIFRPGMIMGSRQEHRSMEKTLIKIFKIINPLFIWGLNKYKGIEGKDIAKAMHRSSKNETEKVKVYHWKEMTALAS